MQVEDKNLKLQAWLDGELPPGEARDIERTVAEDPAAAALLRELKLIKTAVREFDGHPKLPEAREFFWSKIERSIAAQERAAESAATRAGWRILFKRFLVPAFGVAMVVIAGMLAVPRQTPANSRIVTASSGEPAFVYHDDAGGTTLVWLTYPADTEVAMADDPDFLD